MKIKRIGKVLRNFWIDYTIQGKFLGGRVESIDGNKVIRETVSTKYDIIKLIFFTYCRINEDDIIVDVGCGRGRVFNYLLYRGIKNRMIGYEINGSVAFQTKNRLSRFKNVEIVSANILDSFPVHATTFYLYNPFNLSMMEDFKKEILKIKSASNSNPLIIYYNPVCLKAFNDVNFSYQIIETPRNFHKLAIIRLATSIP